MLRSSTALRSLQWRSSLVTLRQQSTAAAAAAAPAEEVQQPSEQPQQPQKQQSRAQLSVRLGGSGRGKSLEAADPFSQFLNNAQQQNFKRMGFRGKQKAKAAPVPGQFDDASEGQQPQQQRPKNQQQQQRSRGNNNNNNNRPQQQQKRQADGANQQRQQRQQRQPRQNNNVSRKPAVESRRVTTFIDKDIDWTAMSGFDDQESEVAASMVSTEQTAEEREKVMLELQTGDYERYFQVSNGMQFAQAVDAESLNSLVGGNASYGFDQKTAFLSAVSKATSGGGAAAAAPQK
ncbi:hypothetical protein BDB00DRAFT_809464 [Zychaea mexicana]|uniref:uncharacterized protein n=1 Tax=Zychaea mexicana TaxID=64656 RepID=UPI0022FE3057|nr:uncharacterized protein BDB00DRAFT_809464 [Zychaea mexicana]KAI9496199.1 hypothetical protein BDB00DRAFT_809464 [Zychaea mexicana]